MNYEQPQDAEARFVADAMAALGPAFTCKEILIYELRFVGEDGKDIPMAPHIKMPFPALGGNVIGRLRHARACNVNTVVLRYYLPKRV